jgi:putative Mg2+ transporter-C (MgtC) family protein
MGMQDLTNPDMHIIVLKLVLAGVLGGIIGFERDMHGRAAGLRTNLLVCMGSALFMLVSEIVANHAMSSSSGSAMGRFADPGRIAAQIITGIGFIGAGAIIKEGFNVRGLTTAACLWLVAGIGMAVGAGLYMLGIYATLIGVASLVVLKNLDKLYPRDSYRTLVIDTPNETELSDIIKPVKQIPELKILYFDFERNYETGVTSVKFTIRLFHKGITDKLSHAIIQTFIEAKVPVRRIKWDHNYS